MTRRGNLKQDVTNGVTNINWTVYGKISTLMNGSGTIDYTYDAGGNRITKTVGTTTTLYVRDAQGNVLSIYSIPSAGTPQQTEVDLYGSSRLGTLGPLTTAPSSVNMGNNLTGWLNTFTRGERSYELGNHLENVLATITDKKIAVPSGTNSSLIDHFTADVVTAQDYYPFGMQMPGRTFALAGASAYRYGFNGKENDNEVKGVGNQIDYGMRAYDPRAGRFMSLDPLQKKFPGLTPYQFASNSPICSEDLDGLESNYYLYEWHQKTGLTLIKKVVQNNEPTFLEELKSAFNFPDGEHLNDVRWNDILSGRREKYSGDPLPFDNIIYVKYFNSENKDVGTVWFEWFKTVTTVNHAEVEKSLENPAPSSDDGMVGNIVAMESVESQNDAFNAAAFSGVEFPSFSILEDDVVAPPALRGMANPKVKSAVDIGNRVHYDQLNGGPAGSVELPSALQARYPNTQFEFTPRGTKGADVKVVGGIHPSQYPGSTWGPANNFGDFKPGTPSGTKTFNRDVRSGKLPANTQKLTYDPTTGKLQ